MATYMVTVHIRQPMTYEVTADSAAEAASLAESLWNHAIQLPDEIGTGVVERTEVERIGAPIPDPDDDLSAEVYGDVPGIEWLARRDYWNTAGV